MTVDVAWDVDERPLTDDAVRALVEEALTRGGRSGLHVAVVFVSDESLAGLHAEWLDDDAPTDVIAFDLGPEGGGPEAEIYCSVDRARELAPARGVDVPRELALYVVHGALHLCGGDDREPEARRRMREREAEVLMHLGYPVDPGPSW